MSKKADKAKKNQEDKKEKGYTSKWDKIEVEWTIVKWLPNMEFIVQLPEDFWWGVINAYLSWKMRIHFIRLIEWDKVIVELSPYDLTRWRIVFRQK